MLTKFFEYKSAKVGLVYSQDVPTDGDAEYVDVEIIIESYDEDDGGSAQSDATKAVKSSEACETDIAQCDATKALGTPCCTLVSKLKLNKIKHFIHYSLV